MSKSVLVVDDDIMNRKMAEYILKKNGYEIVTAQSGEECLNLLETQKPDLILLDIEMPQMNGFELMEILQKSETKKKIPVIFLTADRSEETEENAFR